MARKVAFVRKIPHWPVDKQIAHFQERGLGKRDIYIDGKDAMSWAAIVKSAAPGWTVEVVQFRVLGDSHQAMRAAYEALQAKGGGVYETSTDRFSGDQGPQMLHDAQKRLRGEARAGSKPEMRRRAKLGHRKRRAKIKQERMPDEDAKVIWKNWQKYDEVQALEKINADNRYPMKWTRSTAHRRLGGRYER